MWVSTSEQKLFVIHTPSMKTIASVSLKNNDQTVTDLLHVPEWHAVLVMWSGSEIWYLQDMIGYNEIGVLEKQKLSSHLLHWCEVVLPDKVEVWATQENGKVVVLDWSSMVQRTNILSLSATDYDCYEHITSSYVEESDSLDDPVEQVWVSFKNTSRLTCLDATARTPFYSVKIPAKSETYLLCTLE